MLSTFGPDTLAAFHPVFREEDLPRRIDMHDIGDLLLQEGYADPVLDVDYYTLTYKNRKKLIAELKESHILMPAAAYQEEEITAQEDGTWHAVYEVIYAHAFAPSPQEDLSPSEKGVVRVPLDHVRKQLKLK
jgi:malonyl-CoA O-methyltransferase